MLYQYMNLKPTVSDNAYIAPTAVIIGDVQVGPGASVWFGAVLRGDIDIIRVGSESSIQDNVTVHVTGATYPTLIGDRVIVGHGAILHGCTIEDDALIGMGATVLDNATVGAGAIVAAGALVREGQHVPPGTLVAGVPATVRRKLVDIDRVNMKRILTNYKRETMLYRDGALKPLERQAF